MYPSEDDGKVPGSGLMFDFTDLKKKNPKLKTILSIGGEHSEGFQLIMGSDKSIKTFVQNIYTYIHDRNFDGIDIDWEYPGAIYKKEFVIFLKVCKCIQLQLRQKNIQIRRKKSVGYVQCNLKKMHVHVNIGFAFINNYRRVTKCIAIETCYLVTLYL